MRVAYRVLASALFLLVSGCLTVGPVNFSPTTSSGEILLYADPGVRIQRAGRWLEFEPALVLLTGDRISTASGQAVIDYDQQNIVVLNANTEVQLGSIKLFLGEVFARIRNITRRGGGQVVTNEISAAVSGTEYAVQRTRAAAAYANGVSRVIVREGNVFCEPRGNASWVSFSMKPNQSFSTSYNGREPRLTQVDAAEATRWADQAIARLLRPRTSSSGFNFVLPVGGFGNEKRRDQEDY